MTKKSNASNNDRSNSMNPNNPAHHASTNNRGDQMNPNNSSYPHNRSNKASNVLKDGE